MAVGKSQGLRVILLSAMMLLIAAVSAYAGQNNWSAFTSAGGPLTADGSQQTVATIDNANSGGGATTDSFDITLGGSIGAGDVSGVYVTNGTNTWSITGSFGAQTVTCAGLSAKPGNGTYSINVTLNGSAAGKNITVTMVSEVNNGTSAGLPAGPSAALAINAPPASNTYGALVDGTGPLSADLTQQTVATLPVTLNSGGIAITSFTVDISGSVVAGDVTGVYVTDGTNTWSATGSYGNGSSVACTGANAIPGSPLSINVTLAASADTQTVAVTLTDDSDTSVSLPQGPSTALSITAPAALPSRITSCGDCHTYGPTDGVRAAATGAVLGSHTAHNAYDCSTCHVIPSGTTEPPANGEAAPGYDHRSGDIQMAASIQGGYYDKNGNATDDDGPFNQTDTPVLASCENVACHNNATTPAWGGTVACDSCHNLPPDDVKGTDFAHTAHYAAKGWTTGNTTNCTVCHPDNEAVSHSDVTDGAVEIVLTKSGTGGATTCSSWVNGCHNDAANTPTWSTVGITCGDCHTIGGSNTATVANPASGLHDETPVTSGVIHNPSDANFSGCEDCHTGTPSASHWDGLADTPSTFAAALNYSAGAPATCAATCHSDAVVAGEAWARKWHENSDLSTGAECAGCHGDWANGWNTGVTHRGIVGTDTQPRTVHGTGTNYECKDCHALEAATGYTFATQHANNQITMNSNGTGFARGTGGNSGLSGCTNACHADGFDGVAEGSHSFTTTGWPTVEPVSGDTINSGCDSCHGGSGQYWPAGGAYPNTEGRHDEHMAQISTVLGIALPGTDLEQKRMCQYCHLDPGGSGHSTDSGDSVADVTNFNPIWDLANPPSAGDAGATFVIADGGCNSVACHNNKNTGAGTFGWRDTGTMVCTMCHTPGGNGGAEIADPTSGLHFGTMVESNTTHDDTLDAAGCVRCHTANPSATHRTNGTAETPTVFDGTIGYSSGPPVTCANSCHADGGAWARRWSTTAKNADTTRCDNCHGTFTSANGFVTGMSLRHQTTATGDPGGQIEGNHSDCLTCHTYDGADGYGHKWATDHNDGEIEISDQANFSDDGATVSCNGCHTTPYGTGDGQHSFTDTTATNGWTRSIVAGPAADCLSCHNAHGTGSAGVGPDSPHSNNVTGYTCEGCHTSHGGGTIEIPNYAAVGINYTGNGEAGISLGGTDTTGTTEAEICWNCHNGTQSEWGTNNGGSYNYGTVSTPNWASATWTSANFSYKNGPLMTSPGGQGGGSMHDTLRVPWPASSSDSVADVGCSYCHDVHDTQGPTGKPYLRGTWNPSPYPEDGAPRAGDTYSAGGNPYGAVPRGNTGTTGPGGYQIDQNNGDPNGALGTYAATDGLCASCHPMGTLTSNAPLHTNPLGYSDSSNDSSAARNIFKESDRQAALTRFDPGMAYQNTDSGTLGDPAKGWGGGLRNKDFDTGIAVSPTLGGRYGYQAGTFEWGVTMDDATVDVDFHNFTCSKCHTPHASRLPRLMITNCLDTQNNTWDDDDGAGPAADIAGEANWTNWPNVTPGDNRQLSEAHTAQNCHRNTGEASGPGWNTVTPW